MSEMASDTEITIHARVHSSGRKSVVIHRGNHTARISCLFSSDQDWQTIVCEPRDAIANLVRCFGIGWLSVAKPAIREFERTHGICITAAVGFDREQQSSALS